VVKIAFIVEGKIEKIFIDFLASFTTPKTNRHFNPKEKRQYSPLCNKIN